MVLQTMSLPEHLDIAMQDANTRGYASTNCQHPGLTFSSLHQSG